MQIPLPSFTFVEIPDIVIWYIVTGAFLFLPVYHMINEEVKRSAKKEVKVASIVITIFAIMMWPITTIMMYSELRNDWIYKYAEKPKK